MQIIRLVDFCFSFSLDCMLPFNAVQLRLMRTKQHGCLQMLLKFQQQRSHRQCLEYPLRWVCTFRWNYILFFKYVILYYYDYSSYYFFLWIFNMCNLFFLHNWKNFIQEINHSGAGGLWAELVNNRGQFEFCLKYYLNFNLFLVDL